MQPFDAAWALLKASFYYGADDPKGGTQAFLEGHDYTLRPDAQEAFRQSSDRVSQLTDGGQELSTMISNNEWNPQSAWGGQSETMPFRGVNLSEYGRRLGLGQFGSDSGQQERNLIDHMGQTATHEATHEAQNAPLQEAAAESTQAGNRPSPQQQKNWPSPTFYPGLTGQQATQALMDRHIDVQN